MLGRALIWTSRQEKHRRVTRTKAPVPTEQIADAIRIVRGHKVLLDTDLATRYGVKTRVLVQAVKCNRDRFPADFMFQLTNQEVAALRSQSVISNAQPGRGGRRYAPYAFSEHGALMAATVLNTARAVEMSLYVVRRIRATFCRWIRRRSRRSGDAKEADQAA